MTNKKKINYFLLTLFPKGENVVDMNGWILVKEIEPKNKKPFVMITKKLKQT